MITRSDALEALGLGGFPSKNEIDKAFREKALQYHPDKNNDPNAQEIFKHINLAHNFLIDDLHRQKAKRSGFSTARESYFTTAFATQTQETTYASQTIPEHGWYIDNNFSNVHIRLANQDYNRYFQPNIRFWNRTSHQPSISLSMKNSSEFHASMFRKLWAVAPQWTPTADLSHGAGIEELLRFKLPNDQQAYKDIIELIFAEYQIEPALQEKLRELLGVEKIQYKQGM